MQGPFLDTGVGFLLPVPENFRLLSGPPMVLRSSNSGKSYGRNFLDRTNITVWSELSGHIDTTRWQPVVISHVNAETIEIRQGTRTERAGTRIYEYGFLRDEYGLFISSTLPVDIRSLLNCFIPSP